MVGFKDRSIPLYYQLETILREKIRSGEYPPGDPFPTEDQLVQSYRLSRITVRKALSALEKDGLIDRKRGKGSVVTERDRASGTHEADGNDGGHYRDGDQDKDEDHQFRVRPPPKKVAES